MNFLFVFTFVFGVLRFLTQTKLFDTSLGGFFDLVWPGPQIHPFFTWLDKIIYYLCLAFQVWFWYKQIWP